MSQHHQHPASGTGAPVRAKIPVHHHHPATLAQLADFAAHMVCHLLFGHQAGAASPLSPMPISPQPTTNCHCSACLQQRADSPTAAEGMLPSPVSARPSHVYYDHATCANRSPPTPRSAMSARPTHRRLYSESTDAIPPPTALFRKFCLDVLSATQLSRSVILLSLKYIEKLMIHLKISNKIVNTGEGAEYRFFTGALILANKFLDDNTFTNKTWAEITGMKMVDVNHLEMQFLNGIDFRLFTSPEEYQEWLSALTHFASKHLPALSTVPSHSQPLPAHQHPHPAYQQQPAPLPSQQPTASHHGYGGQHQSHHSTQMRTPISPVDWAPHHSHSHPSAGQDAYELGSYAGQSGSNRSGYPEHPPHPQMPLPGQLPTGAVTNRSSQRMPLSSSYAGYETGTTSARHVAAGKRSAYQAFDDPMEDATLPSSSSTLPPHGPTHKRASLSLSAGMSLLDVNSHPHHHHHHQQHQQQPQQHQQQHTQSLRTLHERSSHGSLRRSYKLGALSTHPYHSHAAAPSSMETHALSHQQHPHQHQQPSHHYLPPSQPRLHVSGSSSRRSHMRTLSDSSFGNHGGRYQHEGYLAPPAHVPAPVALAGPVVGLARNEQPSSSHRSSWSSSARPIGRPRQMSTAGTPSSVTMATTTSAAAVVPSHPFYPTPPPFAPSDKYGHATASMVMGGEPSETRVAMPSSMAVNGPAGGPAYSPHHYPHHHHHHHPSEFEFDPRMWAPFDSLSLYAITSQAAKRVVAHSKVLSASASNLHVYYPTSLA
ncbi:hypothetical protein DFQ27_003195 [Actinomortierella ambigua]|uniref:Cyclin n=1 Tax=Actinomortierella ambigua TaxID=1343610 RepID=A0A9P6QJG8_9FUNG|nr:hypothetical protein DFQ27_003195 [Actinomortierella ambigua]